MVKWRVRLTVEKVIEAPDRGTAKALLVEAVRHPKAEGVAALFDAQPESFTLCPTVNGTQPICIDVSASKVTV